MRLDDLLEDKYQFATLLVHDGHEPENILSGRYCRVLCHRLSEGKEEDQVFFEPYWENVGGNSTEATDEEWIAYTISNFPHADNFINFTTFDQVEHWIACKDQAVELAYCFLTEPDQPNDKLCEALKAGQIDQFSYDYGCASAKVYKSFWNMLKKDGQKIVESLKTYKQSYPFNSSRELMAEIVRELYEGEFFRCLKRRAIYKAYQIKKIAKLKRKQHKEELSDKEQRELYKLIDLHVPFAEVYNNTLGLAQQIATKDPSTATNLEDFYRSIKVLSQLQIQSDCKPELRQKHGRKSHTWEQGKKIQGVPSWRS